MKLENQLSSLEPSQKLKELGVKQKSLFCWFNPKDDIWQIEPTFRLVEQTTKLRAWVTGKRIISAFTVAELFNKLPKGFFLGKDDDYYCGCNIEYIEDINPEFYKKLDDKLYGWLDDFAQEQTEDNNPADCLAKMLIYLKENKLI